jgi:hypothetical protein
MIDRELIREGRAPAPWYTDLVELASFCRWMEETGRAPRDRWEMVQLADRYGAEHAEFVREETLEALADEDEAFTELERRRGL